MALTENGSSELTNQEIQAWTCVYTIRSRRSNSYHLNSASLQFFALLSSELTSSSTGSLHGAEMKTAPNSRSMPAKEFMVPDEGKGDLSCFILIPKGDLHDWQPHQNYTDWGTCGFPKKDVLVRKEKQLMLTKISFTFSTMKSNDFAWKKITLCVLENMSLPEW